MTTLTWDRHRGHASELRRRRAGFNYRLDEIRAALGLVQLAAPDRGERARAAELARYRERLHGTSGMTMPFDERRRPWRRRTISRWRCCRRASTATSPAALAERRIQTSVHYPPIHGFSAYRARRPAGRCRETDAVAARLLTLPLYGGLSDEQVECGSRGPAQTL